MSGSLVLLSASLLGLFGVADSFSPSDVKNVQQHSRSNSMSKIQLQHPDRTTSRSNLHRVDLNSPLKVRQRHIPGVLYASVDENAAVTSESSSTDSNNSLLGGTEHFLSWFQSKDVGGKQRTELKHATFRSNTLRGLEYAGSNDRGVIEIPEKVVLRTEYNRNTKDGKPDDMWDARLASMLVKECLKGDESDISG